MKSYHIITFGCQMNEHDSERIAGILDARGYTAAANAEKADLVIVNTCSIREKAEQKFFSELGRLKNLKSGNPELKIAVAGCIAQQEGAGIRSRAPHVDLVFGPSDVGRFSELLDRAVTTQVPVIDTTGDVDYHTRQIPTTRRDRLKAWVSIMYGCDNFCTYCIVPHVRGRERSRPSAEIVQEVRGLASRGYKEVTLLGQNVNSYGKGSKKAESFPELLGLVNDVPGIERVRFVTSHPRDLSDELILAIAELPKVCEAVHLPVQSGSDAMLKSMNRRYTRQQFLDRVEKLRRAVPRINITTDIIVGFPGETDQDFDLTIDLLKRVGFDGIFAFKYSRRPGTAALELADHLPEAVKEIRLEKVLSLQKTITLKHHEALIGTVQEVLLEGLSKKGGTVTGRTRGNTAVNLSASPDLVGTLVNVEITAAGMNSLTGRLCESL